VVKTQYAANHPEYKKAERQQAELQRQFDVLRANVAERVAVEYRDAQNREQMLQQEVQQTKDEFDQHQCPVL